MPFTSSMRFAATILTIISAASAIRLQWRHDGRSHQGAHDAVAPALQPRQLNGAAGGIQPVSSRSPSLAVSISTGMPTSSGSLTLTSTLSFEYTSLATGTFTRPATPTGEVNAYIFPSSMIQVPVATICPDTPSILLNTTAGSGLVSATAFLPNGSSTVYLSTPTHPANSFNASSYTPVPLPSPISVCYPDTDPNCPSEPNATFSVTPIPLPTANAANATGNDAAERVILDSTARILLDDRGCQTVYSPSYTALCRTTVQLAGMPEATVTDCAQWVTFSSDTKGCSDAATTSVGGPEARDDIEGNDRGSTTALPTTMAEVTPSMGSALPMMTVKPGTYYAAHWVDLSRGGVPANVRVEECEAERACHTFREKWSESKATGVLVKESVASFEGPAILTSGSSTITTTLSFLRTVSKTVTTVSATIVKNRLDGEISTSTPATLVPNVPASETPQETPQVTMQLVKVTPPAAAPTIVEPAPAVQGQDEQMNGNESGNDGGSADVQEGGSFYDADGGNEDTRVGEPQDDVKMEDAADGVMTVTVEETHTSTRLVYETRTMTP